ncbi:MAG: hypothetical protein DWI02_11075 [Planctomycetota bacterium]|nr:MAG: hypothetical protein DWI02_11075 [Planctomycetota bacterium]
MTKQGLARDWGSLKKFPKETREAKVFQLAIPRSVSGRIVQQTGEGIGFPVSILDASIVDSPKPVELALHSSF